jgi:hypothetical protein
MPETIILDRDCYRADSFIDIGEHKGAHLSRLLAAGIIEPATLQLLERLATRSRVGMKSGATWGSGSYVAEQAATFYVMAEGFNLGHLELAIRRMYEQDIQSKRDDLFARLDGAMTS